VRRAIDILANNIKISVKSPIIFGVSWLHTRTHSLVETSFRTLPISVQISVPESTFSWIIGISISALHDKYPLP